MTCAAKLGQDREGVGIPFQQDLVGRHGTAVFDAELRAVHDLVSLLLTTLLVDNRHNPVAVHRYEVAFLVADARKVHELRKPVRPGILRRLLTDSGRRAADMECPHGQLRTRFTNRLGSNHTHCLAAFDKSSGGQVAAVAHAANASLGFTGQHRSNLDPFDTGPLDGPRQLLGDLLIHRHDDVALVVLDFFL